MGYCGTLDIANTMPLKTLIELSNESTGASETDDDIIENIINENSKIIDAFLYGTYSVPVIGSETLIKICKDLTYCDLFERKIGLDLPEPVMARRKRAYELLDKIQKGQMNLETGSVETRPPFIKVSERTEVFSDTNLKTY